MSATKLRILTWHVHGNYMYYLSHVPHDFYLATLPGDQPGHAGKVGDLPWPDNVHEIALGAVRDHEFDCVLYQSRDAWLDDRVHALTHAQRRLPAIFLEHDPPQEHPVSTRHFVQDANTLLVHVTAFNALMWDNGITPHRVVEHGVKVPDNVKWRGDLARGVVVVNNLARRGRRLGADVFETLRERVPLDLYGMNAEESGGIGEMPNTRLAAACAPYRFFFHPARYTSLGLALIEAMMIGMPIVGLATTELATVIRSGDNGWVDTRLDSIEWAMRTLLYDPGQAAQWGEAARATAMERFNIRRFVSDWEAVFAEVAG